MKLLTIANNVIKQGLRNFQVMAIMVLMPVVLIFILGVSFEGMIGSDSTISMDNVSVTYQVIGEEASLTEGFEQVMEEMLKDGDNLLQKMNDKESALKELENNDLTCFVEIDEENDEINIYKSSLNSSKSSLIEGILRTYTTRYNVIVHIAHTNPQALSQMNTEGEAKEYTVSKSLDPENSPSSMNYYGVSMCVLFVLYGVLTPTLRTIDHKDSGIFRRMMMSATKPGVIFWGEALGSIGIVTVQIGIVMLFTTVVYGVNWGENLIYPIVLILTEIIMIVSIGTTLGYIIKKESVASAIAHTGIVIMAFFGGAYLAIEDMGSLSEVGKYFSIVWWNNTAIFNLIYANDMTIFYKAISINLLAACMFFSVALAYVHKKEGL